mmetsp:Transcript_51905/g.121445  ORF Transcript_51905/g.121445 Transcript_51905/m.121445 type:complete len:475 (-) Transcript_51905:47-1471(-)
MKIVPSQKVAVESKGLDSRSDSSDDDASRPKEPLTHEQTRVLILVAFIYAASCLVYRGSFATAMPQVLEDVGASRAQGGKVLSIAALVYSFAKPAACAFSDRFSPRYLLLIGSCMPAIGFFLMAVATDIGTIKWLMVMVHVMHAPNWPGVSGMLCKWFPPMRRGLPYSVVSAQINVVSALIPLVIGVLSDSCGGWRGAFVACSFVNLFGGAFVFSLLHEPIDLESIDLECCSSQRQVSAKASWGRQQSVEKTLASGSEVRVATLPRRLRRTRLEEVVSLRTLQCIFIALSSMMVYLVRFAVEFWISTYFADMASEEHARGRVIVFMLWWQLGGALGTLAVGPLTDNCGGNRLAPAVLLGAVSVGAFCLPFNSSLSGLALISAVAGFTCFGNRVLYMLAIRQAVPAKWGGRAEAINFLFAELGGVIAGWPLITLLESFGGLYHLQSLLIMVAMAQVFCTVLALGASHRAQSSHLN